MADELCVACGMKVTDEDKVVCRSCSSPQHRECWLLVQKCSAQDCRGLSWRLYPEKNKEEAIFTIERPLLPDSVMGVIFLSSILITIGILTPFKNLLGKGGSAAVVFVLVYGFIYLGQLRWRLQFDDSNGLISRQLLYNVKPIGSYSPWLYADKVASVLYRQKGRKGEVIAFTTDGQKYFIDFTGRMFRTHYHKIQLSELAQRMASFSNVELTKET